MNDETPVCQNPSPELDGTRYWCHLPAGHDGFHRDDLGVVLWDDSRPDPIWPNPEGWAR